MLVGYEMLKRAKSFFPTRRNGNRGARVRQERECLKVFMEEGRGGEDGKRKGMKKAKEGRFERIKDQANKRRLGMLRGERNQQEKGKEN